MAQLEEAALELLRNSAIFRGVGEEAVRSTAGDGRAAVLTAEKRQVIYAPDAFSHSLGLLLSGRVQVSKGELIVSVLSAGEIFGAAALFNERPDYATTLTARSDCRILFLPQTLLEGKMEEYPELAANYIRYLSGRIRFLERKIDALIVGGAEGRLARCLLAMEERGEVRLDCSLTGFASRLNVSRASLYRALDALETAGAIKKEGRSIRLLNRETLRGICRERQEAPEQEERN